MWLAKRAQISLGDKNSAYQLREHCSKPVRSSVLDEATAGLDAITATKVLQSIYHRFENKTILTITHDLAALTQMDRIIVIDAGRIVADGRHQDLMGQAGIYPTLVQAYNAVH